MYNIAIMLYYAMVCRVKIRKRGRKHMSNKKKILAAAIALSMVASAMTGFAAPVDSNVDTSSDLESNIAVTDVENVELADDQTSTDSSTDSSTDESTSEKTTLYSENLKEAKSGDVTNKVTGTDASLISNYSVADFGTGTDVTTAVPALDGWGYQHWGYASGLTEGRQTSAHIVPTENAFYVQGVGNQGCSGSISFIPKNVDNLTLPESGVLIYEFDAIVTTTGGNKSGKMQYGFTSADNGATLTSVKSVALSSTGVNNEASTYKMTMVYDITNGKYYIYVDGELQAEGDSNQITGIYAQTTALYIKAGIANLNLYSTEQAPNAVKVEFKGDGDTVLATHPSVLEGSKLAAPEAPSISGKTFKGWKNAAGETVTEFVAGSEDTVYTAVYEEGSTVSTVNASTNSFAKLTIKQGDNEEIVKYTAADGKAEFKDIPQGTYTYTISKKGYTPKSGTFELGVNNYDFTEKAELDADHSDYIFYESDWTNGSGELTNGTNADANSRSFSTNLSTEDIQLPATDGVTDVFTIHAKVKVGNLGSRVNSVSTLLLKSDKGVLVGINWSKANGIYALTGWNGGDTPTADADTIDKATNKLQLVAADGNVTDKIAVDFTVDSKNNSITVNCNGETVGSLPVVNGASSLKSLVAGVYREYCDTHVYELSVEKPDPNYLGISGDTSFAKISGQTIEKTYTKTETTVVPDEEFKWSVVAPEGAPENAVTIDNNGKLSVKDTATAGEYTIKCSSKTNTEKAAEVKVKIADFQKLTLKADGARAYTLKQGQTGKYKLTSAVDSLDADVLALIPAAKWTSSNTDVATITDEGELTVVGAGSTTITATVTNGTVVSKVEIPVTVDTYSIVADATENSTVVDTTQIVSGDNIKKYLVTTATADGKLVMQTQVDAADVVAARVTKTAENGVKIIATYENGLLKGIVQADVEKGTEITAENTTTTKVFYWTSLAEMNPIALTTEAAGSKTITVDTTGAAKVEIAPIFETSMNTLLAVPSDSYNVTITANNGRRTDVYVNDQMMFNNINQGSDNWTIGRNVAESTDYTVHDIVVTQGYAKFNYRDDQSSGTTITNVKFSKSPSIVTRTKKVYVIGDSLVANYYGTAPEGKEGLVRTGWGQVLQNYISGAEVVNLGNSGAWATGMKADAFTNVLGSAQPGDIMVLESGYNDKVHSNEADMKAAVTDMLTTANDMGLTTFLVTPNASYHDYEEDVIYSAAIRTVAEEVTSTNLIDLAKKSYAFLNDKYGALDNAARRYVLVGDKDNAGIYNNAVWNEDNSKISGDKGLHSTNNAANCWAAIIAQGLYDNEATRNVVDTNYKYTFNDGTNDISVGVSTSTTTD